MAFTWNAPPHLALRKTHTWVVITFTKLRTDSTKVRLGHTGFLDAPDWDATWTTSPRSLGPRPRSTHRPLAHHLRSQDHIHTQSGGKHRPGIEPGMDHLQNPT